MVRDCIRWMLAERTSVPKRVSDKVQQALDEFKFSAHTYDPQRKREIEYLKFQVPELQWEQRIRDYRESQFGNQGVPMPPDPCLSISMIDEPISLVDNQERAAHLGVHIHPLSEDADKDTATVLEELYRHIEVDKDSRADVARSWMFQRTTRAGRGWYYVDKVFDPYGGHPFDQKLLIKRCLYQDWIYPDPTAEHPAWMDGMFLHDLFELPWSTYKKRYKNQSKLANYTEGDFKSLGPVSKEWVPYVDDLKKRAIRLSNYWRVEIEKQRIHLLDDGSVGDAEDLPPGRRVATDEDVQQMFGRYDIMRHADIDKRRVFKSVINGVEEVEEEQEWDGQFIPYVPGLGIELQPFDGERRFVGMIANAMDAQRLTNYSASQAVKLAALETQANWQGEEGVFEGHEEEYRQSNTRKFPFLQYAATNAAGMRSTPPQRVQVDTSRLGPSMELLAMGKEFVQRAMFTFGPGLGEQTPAHRSGVAIQELQGQTSLGTSHYLDNMATISLPCEAAIVLDLMPAVYSRPGRVVHVLTGEGKSRAVMLNAPYLHDKQGKPTQAIKVATPGVPLPDGVMHYDLSKGNYGVTITIGKQQDVRLQEGNEAITRIMESDPSLVPVLGPTWARFQDFPGHTALEKAMEKWQAHVAPWMLDGPQTPEQLVNQLQAQVQQLTGVVQQQQRVIDTKQVEQMGKLAVTKEQESHEDMRAAMEREKAIAVAEIQAQAKQALQDMALFYEERARIGAQIHETAEGGRDAAHNLHLARESNAHDARMAAMEHATTMAESAQEHTQAMSEAAQAHAHALDQSNQQTVNDVAAAQATQPDEPSGE